MVLSFHHVPGRIRVSLGTLKRNQPAVGPLRAKLLELPGLQTASVNAWTGSVIVRYDRERFEPESFWSTLRQLGHFEAPAFPSNETMGAAAALKAIEDALLSAALEHFLGRSAGAVIGLLI